MQIYMTVNGRNSSFDLEDILESGQTIGEVIGQSIDDEIRTNPNLREIIVEVKA